VFGANCIHLPEGEIRLAEDAFTVLSQLPPAQTITALAHLTPLYQLLSYVSDAAFSIDDSSAPINIETPRSFYITLLRLIEWPVHPAGIRLCFEQDHDTVTKPGFILDDRTLLRQVEGIYALAQSPIGLVAASWSGITLSASCRPPIRAKFGTVLRALRTFVTSMLERIGITFSKIHRKELRFSGAELEEEGITPPDHPWPHEKRYRFYQSYLDLDSWNLMTDLVARYLYHEFQTLETSTGGLFPKDAQQLINNGKAVSDWALDLKYRWGREVSGLCNALRPESMPTANNTWRLLFDRVPSLA
jgi:hypothetical protein